MNDKINDKNIAIKKFPKSISIEPNYPNPFNPITTITYQVPEYSNVSIKIYNLSGQIIQNIHNGFMSPGEYSVSWDAKNFSSGFINISQFDSLKVAVDGS